MDVMDQSVIQEIVDHWGNSGMKQQLSENDVLSLFEVLNGHFITRTGDSVKPIVIEDDMKIIDCKECGKMFTTIVNLERHKLLHQDRNKFICTKCDKKFISDAGLSKHMTKHIEPVKCSQCDKMFSTQEYLDQHMTVHNDKMFGKTY